MIIVPDVLGQLQRMDGDFPFSKVGFFDVVFGHSVEMGGKIDAVFRLCADGSHVVNGTVDWEIQLGCAQFLHIPIVKMQGLARQLSVVLFLIGKKFAQDEAIGETAEEKAEEAFEAEETLEAEEVLVASEAADETAETEENEEEVEEVQE